MFPRPRPLLLLALLAGALAAPGRDARAQGRDWQAQARGGLQVSVATRIDSTGAESRLANVRVPLRSLVFTRRGGAFHAGVTVTAVATRGGKRVGGGVGSAELTVPDYAATRAEGALACAVPLLLRGAGRAELDLTVAVDGTSRVWRERVSVSPGEGLHVPVYFADFAWNLEGAPGPALGAGVDTLQVRVSLGRRPNVAAWPDGGVALLARLAAAGQEDAASPRRLALAPVPAGGRVAPLVLRWPAASLPFGRLTLALWLESGEPARPERLDLDAERTLVNLAIRFDDDGAWRQHVGWLEGLADGERRRQLAACPPVDRAAAWRVFWDQVAGPGPAAVESERAHLRRVVEADERFGGFGRGALSDRGRVWIRYGPPDTVEQRGDEFSFEGRWEIWSYHQERLVFSFFDPHGLGDYRLAGSGSL